MHAQVHPVAQCLESRLLLAAQQVADLNTRPASSSPAQVTDVGGTAFFAATNNGVGRELFKTDGTPAGTTLVKDINPGPAGSDPSSLINVNGTLFFIATFAYNDKQLWKSDGTTAGTVRVSDNVNLYTPTYSSVDPGMAVLNGELFFRGYDPVAGVEVWKSDGTDAGTVRVKDINPGVADSRPAYFERVGGVVVFQADDGVHGAELWKTDGTEAGTVLVKDVWAGPDSSYPQDLTASGGFVYFTARSAADSPSELWRTDGTPAGTIRLTPPQDVPFSFLDLTDVNGTLFFAGYTSNGNALWASDGTAQGTRMIKSFVSNDGDYGYAESLTNVGGTLFFRVLLSSPVSSELWKSDGTPQGTVRLDSFPSPFIDGLTAVGTRLYFSATTPEAGRELWASDGAPGGARMVADLEPGPESSDAFPLAAFAGNVILVADVGAAGSEPWISDGTAAGTVPLGEVNPGTEGSFPHDLQDFNGSLYFQVRASSALVLKANPAGDGVVTVVDGQSGLGPIGSDLTASGPWLYFTEHQIGPVRGPWLMKTDGTPGPATQVDSLNGVAFITDLNGAGTVLLSATLSGLQNVGQELYRSDGTDAGTVLVKDINPLAGSRTGSGAAPTYLTKVGGAVFFTADDGTHGRELWKSDGTEAGTVLVRDIVTGATGSNPWGLVAVGSTLFFRVPRDGGDELWKSDGTEAGTVRVAALPATTPAVTSFFGADDGDWRRGTALGNVFIFAAGGAGSGTAELWRSDGTEAGTLRVADTGPGPTGPRNSDPEWFARYGDRVYFNAFDPQWGRELWFTDGTAAGTGLFQDIYPGVGSSDPAWLKVSGDTLWFGATGIEGGNELWKVTLDLNTDTRVNERQLFYNNSVFDQHDDDPIHDLGAVASDKRALLPGGGVATFENLSSYGKGINGILVGFFSPGIRRPHDLGPDDFEFRMGTAGDPATWQLAPAPSAVRVIPVPGPNSLYSLTWPDGAIRNTWLRVTIKANDHTTLPAPDVFYFGNLAGESGDRFPAGFARVSALDLAAVRRTLTPPGAIVDRTSRTDFNRDGVVDALDLAEVRRDLGHALPWLTAPATAPARGAAATDLLRTN